VRRIAGLLLLCAGLCLATLAAADPADERTLRRGNSTEPLSLDPHRAEDVASGNVVRDLFEGLVTEAPDGAIIPGAAVAWSVSDDGLSYIFRLRDCLAWSNGDALTAADFVFSLKRAVDPATGAPLAGLLAPIRNAAAILRGDLDPRELGIEMPDSHTLVIRLERPMPAFLQVLSQPIAFPVYATSLIAHGDVAFSAGRLVSNGAYTLAAWSPYESLTLARNRRYHADAATWFERVVYLPIEDNNAEFNRYRAGELDWTDTLPAGKLEWIREQLPGQAFISPYLGTYYYGFNLTRPPFKDNPELRRALALAIDREVIAMRILGNGEIPASGWLPPTLRSHPADPAGEPGSVQAARDLIARAGHGPDNPLAVTLHFNTSEQNRRIAVAVAAMWKQRLGVRTELVNEEWKVFLGHRKGKQVTQLYRASWIADVNDALNFLEIFTSGHPKNDTGYADPVYDELVARAGDSADPAQRAALVAQAEARLLAAQVIIPIYHYVSRHLVKPDIRGHRANPLDHHYSRHLYRESRG